MYTVQSGTCVLSPDMFLGIWNISKKHANIHLSSSPWLYAKDMEIDILATLVENFEKCPPPWPIPGYAPDCHAELQDFLRRHQVLVACVQETKLDVNSSLKEFIDYATVRRDRPTGGGGGGLVTLVHHSVPCRVPDRDMMTQREFWQSRLTSREPHWPSSMSTSLRVLLPSELRPRLRRSPGGPWRPNGAWRL